MTDGVTAAGLERVRNEAAQSLSAHELECAKQYGALNGRLEKVEALMSRNTRLLYLILGGMLTVLARSFWPLLGG